VDYHIKVFTTKRRESFIRWLQRSGKYIDIIKEILKEEGLPEELVYLPLIESGFDTSAKSRRKAVGPWQFISATARKYGLKINYWVDERRDPEKSTKAAAKYLKELYNRFGSWPLALAAYNAGEGKIYRAVRRVRTDDYWKIVKAGYLKRETRNYVARFIAAGLIASDPEKYGLDDVDIHPPLRYEKVVITKPASISFIARCSNVSKSVIRELNPELKRWCTPPDVKTYEIKIPEGVKEEFLECFNSASASERMPRVPYVIKKGDTIYEIAKRHRVSVKSVLLLNKGVNPRRLRPGRIIYLPPE
jgi:membrane-bound lytic murein transglycosylase D